MELKTDICPYCGQQILKGAMRCLACGRILKTPEEQAEAIERLRKTKKGFDFGRLIRFLVFFCAAAVLYYFFSDEIKGFLSGVFGS
jgi:uncharacterized membrane protein YvbJ